MIVVTAAAITVLALVVLVIIGGAAARALDKAYDLGYQDGSHGIDRPEKWRAPK